MARTSSGADIFAGLKRRFDALTPSPPGWSVGGRAFAALGAAAAIALGAALSSLVAPGGAPLPFIVAPIGASAVLVFAVPSSPLAQPWAVIVGNVLSALTGIATARAIGDARLAVGVAVGVSIALMSLTRSLHPPGGAAALLCAMLAHREPALGLSFALVPVGLNSALLAASGWLFHRFSGHTWPHVPARTATSVHDTSDPPPRARSGWLDSDIDAALARMGETFDIDRDDLGALIRRVETAALMRRHGPLSCADIMSRDVLKIDQAAKAEDARRLVRDHCVRSLPVVNAAGVLVGMAGICDLLHPDERIASVMSDAATARPDDPALALVETLADGRTHAVAVVDTYHRPVGVITQTDLLAALSKRAHEPA
ncbi:MAG: HPP family protein [Hyphomicrobiales bacterium]|nr:HPP family protein [Hyphomicrobiales bacterium]MDE2018098.1 HPP family protein [Hyphomicrobiales bacterium]